MKNLLNKTIFLLLILTCVTRTAWAQVEDEIRAELSALPLSDGHVLLRWAPVNQASWEWGLEHGYVLYRAPVILNGGPATIDQIAGRVILADGLKPLDAVSFEEFVNQASSDWPAIGAGAIYGEEFTLINTDTASILDVANLAAERNNRYSMGLFAAAQDFATAQAMGLALEDEISLNSTFVYFIELKNAPPSLAKTTKIEVTNIVLPEFPMPRFSGEAGDRTVVLRWEKDDLEKHYVGYDIERMGGNGIFEKLNTRPIVFVATNAEEEDAMYHKDSLPENGQMYSYRIRGLTAFGTYGPYSEEIKLTGQVGPIQGLEIMLKTKEDNPGPGRITLEWNFTPETRSNISADIQIWRATEVNAPYELLTLTPVNVEDLRFTDVNPLPVNYYKILFNDNHGHVHESMAALGQPNDATAPAILQQPVCTCNKEGLVRITWPKGQDPDIMGYRVFTSNNEYTEDMQQVTSNWIKDTSYSLLVDMQTLTKQLFYSVRAIDFRENQSPLSPPCLVMRPDVLPPSSPVIAKYDYVTNGTEFSFIPSSSDDVVQYKFQRRQKNYVSWTDLATLQPAPTLVNYRDSTADSRYIYEYRLVAYDAANLAGASNVIELRPKGYTLRPPILNLLGTSWSGLLPPKAIVLTWQYPQASDRYLMGFQILRAVGGDPLRNLLFLTVAEATSPNLNPGSFDFTWTDFDVPYFKQLVNSGLVQPPGGNPPGGPTIPGGPAVTNVPTHSVGPTGMVVYYGVYAKYTDGTTSPLATFTMNW